MTKRGSFVRVEGPRGGESEIEIGKKRKKTGTKVEDIGLQDRRQSVVRISFRFPMFSRDKRVFIFLFFYRRIRKHGLLLLLRF